MMVMVMMMLATSPSGSRRFPLFSHPHHHYVFKSPFSSSLITTITTSDSFAPFTANVTFYYSSSISYPTPPLGNLQIYLLHSSPTLSPSTHALTLPLPPPLHLQGSILIIFHRHNHHISLFRLTQHILHHLPQFLFTHIHHNYYLSPLFSSTTTIPCLKSLFPSPLTLKAHLFSTLS